MSIKTFQEFSTEIVLSEDAKSILDKLLASPEYKALTIEIENLIDSQAHDSEDYTLLVSSIIPKLILQLKSKFNVK
jgi:hypothetical protein